MGEIINTEQYKAVPILKPGGVLDQDALISVLEQPLVRNKPIMLLSVAGAFRKGKSFLLTLFLRYLRKKGYNSDNNDWIGKEDINDGFSWKGGSDATTQGILIWNEPFFVKDKKEREVAILLMDTQGLFDYDSNKALCTKIFAFSTLLSSVQVFNLSNQIQENDLEYLQFFVEYASAARKLDSVKSKPFQNLMFLIRDWQHCMDHEFGLDEPKGGYLDRVLKRGESSGDLSAVRKGIKKSFQNLECFLMPDPGRKVAVTRKEYQFAGEIKDIDEEFLEYVGKLAKCLLSPEKVLAKTIENQLATSTDLLNFAISCNRNVMSGTLPTPKSLLESNAEVYSLKAIEECRRKYEELVNEKFNDFVLEGKIQKRHNKIVDEVKAMLKEKLTFGGDEITGKYKKQFAEWIDNKEEMIRRKNGFLRAKKVYDMKNKRVLLVKEYEEKVSYEPGGGEEIWKKIEEDFHIEFSDYPEFSSQKNQMKAARKRFDKDRLHGAKSFQRDRAEMERGAATKQVMAKRGQIVEKARSKWILFEQDDVELSVEQIVSMDESEYEKRERRDSDMLEFQSVLGDLCGKLLQKYGQAISEGIKDRYVKPEVMQEMHKILSDMVFNTFRSNEELKEYSGNWVDKTREICERKLQNALDDAFEDFRILNEKNEKFFMITTNTTSAFINSLDDATIRLGQIWAFELIRHKSIKNKGNDRSECTRL